MIGFLPLHCKQGKDTIASLRLDEMKLSYQDGFLIRILFFFPPSENFYLNTEQIFLLCQIKFEVSGHTQCQILQSFRNHSVAVGVQYDRDLSVCVTSREGKCPWSAFALTDVFTVPVNLLQKLKVKEAGQV